MWVVVAVLLAMVLAAGCTLVGVFVGYGLAERNHERGDWS